MRPDAAVQLLTLVARRRASRLSEARSPTRLCGQDHGHACSQRERVGGRRCWANHTADVECSMRRILDHHGYRCDVTVALRAELASVPPELPSIGAPEMSCAGRTV